MRATGTMFGHTMETQFPLGLGLAALSISRGALFPPNDPTGLEIEMPQPPTGGVKAWPWSRRSSEHSAGRVGKT